MRNVIIVGKDSVDSKLTLAGDEGADALMSNSPSARPTLEDAFALLLVHDEGEEKREVPLGPRPLRTMTRAHSRGSSPSKSCQ